MVYGSDDPVHETTKTRGLAQTLFEIRPKNEANTVPRMGVKDVLVLGVMQAMDEHTEAERLEQVVPI